MTDRFLDMRGKPCPEPVIATRQALADPSVHCLTVLIDNEGSAENVARAARQLGCDVALEQQDHGFILVLSREPNAARTLTPVGIEPALGSCGPGADVAVLVASATLGEGDPELGRLLMVAFLRTVGKIVPRPKTLAFMNAGVRLTTNGSEVLDVLRDLEQQGVRIWSCGTCLDFFGLKAELAVGTVSNMFDIASALVAADRVIRP